IHRSPRSTSVRRRLVPSGPYRARPAAFSLLPLSRAAAKPGNVIAALAMPLAASWRGVMSDILTSPNLLKKNARHPDCPDGGLSNEVTLISGTSGQDRDLVLAARRSPSTRFAAMPVRAAGFGFFKKAAVPAPHGQIAPMADSHWLENRLLSGA